MRQVRLKTIRDFIQPYTKIRIDFLAKKMRISEVETEYLCVQLIMSQQIVGKIDQLAGVLDLSPMSDKNKKITAISHWIDKLEGLSRSVELKSRSVYY